MNIGYGRFALHAVYCWSNHLVRGPEISHLWTDLIHLSDEWVKWIWRTTHRGPWTRRHFDRPVFRLDYTLTFGSTCVAFVTCDCSATWRRIERLQRDGKSWRPCSRVAFEESPFFRMAIMRQNMEIGLKSFNDAAWAVQRTCRATRYLIKCSLYDAIYETCFYVPRWEERSLTFGKWTLNWHVLGLYNYQHWAYKKKMVYTNIR